MATIATLIVDVVANTAGLFGPLDKDTQRLEQSLNRMSSSMTKVGAGLTAAVTVPIVGIGAASLKMAMDAVESENLFEVSFKEMAGAARAWSEETSEALGLNQFELRRTSATLFTMLDSMGIAKEGAFAMATGMTELAHDMASFFNLKPEEAFEKLRAGIVGEAEPLKRLGILVDENTVKTAAYKHGIAAQGAELTQQQKVLARYAAIMDQTKNAQGDLARTLDSPTNQLRRMREQITEAATAFGMALLPAAQQVIALVSTHLVPAIQRAVEVFGNLPSPVRTGAIVVAALAAAIGPLLLAFGYILSSVSTLLPLLRTLGLAHTAAAAGATTQATATAAAAASTATAGVAAATAAPKVTLLGLAASRTAITFGTLRALSVASLAGLVGLGAAAATVGVAIGKWIADMKPFGESVMSIGESFEFGATKLFNWARGMKVADEDIERAIVSRRQLATATDDTAAAMTKSTEAVLKEAAALAASTETSTKALKAADQLAKQRREWTNQLEEMHIAEIERVQTHAQALAELDRQGLQSLYDERRRQAEEALAQADQNAQLYLERELRAYQDQQAAATEHWKTISQINNAVGLKLMEQDAAKMRGVWVNFFDGVATAAADLSRAFEQLATIAGGSFGTVARAIGTSISAINLAAKSTDGMKTSFGRLHGEGRNVAAGLAGIATNAMGMVSAFMQATEAGGTMMKTLSGAAVGAQIGSAFGPIGTAIGAGVGAIGGLFRGLFGKTQGRKDLEEANSQIKKLQDGLLAAHGSLEEIVRGGGAAGQALADAWGSQNREGLAHFTTLMNEFNKQQEAAKNFAKDLDGILREVASSGQLASKELLGMIDTLEAAGQLTKEISAFRLASSSTAASGLNAFFQAYLTGEEKLTEALTTRRTLEDQASDLRKRIAEAEGGQKQKLIADYAVLQRQIENVTATIRTQETAINIVSITSQETADAMSSAVLGIFGSLTANGMTAMQALKQLEPSIQSLSTQLERAGLKGNDAFTQILGMSRMANDQIAGPALKGVQGLGDALGGLHNAGLLNQQMFVGLTNQITQTFQGLVAQGYSGNNALRLMQPTLQRIWQLQQDFGFEVDESTQLMLDQAKTAGLVGDQHRSASDKMAKGIDRLVLLMETFLRQMGLDVPNALDSATRAGKNFTDTLGPSLDELIDQGEEFNRTLSTPATKIITVKYHDLGLSRESERSEVAGLSDAQKREKMEDFVRRNPGDTHRIPSALGISADEARRLGFQSGTHGRFLDFGAGTPITVHGRERIMTEGEGRLEARSVAVLVAEVRALRADQAAQRRALRDDLFLAVRDGTAHRRAA